jgi:hypothetical protein
MKKRYPDTPLANWALQELAEYIASRRDPDTAGPREIEAALKKAGKLPSGDRYYTAFRGTEGCAHSAGGSERER